MPITVSSITRAGAGLAAAALVAAALAVTAQSAHAAPVTHADTITDNEIYTNGVKVTSSTHKALRLYLSADAEGHDSYVSLAVATRSGHEQHLYYLAAKVSLSKGNGAITLSSSHGHGYAVVHLKASRTSLHRHDNCIGNYTESGKLTLTGSLKLNTKSSGKHKWGTIGSTHAKITLHGDWTEQHGTTSCGSSYHEKCAVSSSWSGSFASDGDVGVFGGDDGRGMIEGERITELGKYGARIDLVDHNVATPVLTGSGATAQYTVRTGKSPAHGSLTFNATSAPSTATPTCYRHGTASTETRTTWQGATVTDHGFHLDEQIFGSFGAPTTATFSTTG